MADLSTDYMGLSLRNPLIIGASSLTSDMETLHGLEKAGAGAVVIRSLFEEQIQREHEMFDLHLSMYDDRYWEHANMQPELEFKGAARHLYWVRRAASELEIPVIGSLNAINLETWVEYAAKMEEAGVSGLELNLYSTPTDLNETSSAIEGAQVQVVEEVRKTVGIPISVKMGRSYTNPLNAMAMFDTAGADGLVLFNRFLQPTIDTETLAPLFANDPSDRNDHRVALRYTGLASDSMKADICGSGGIHTGQDIARLLLVGAASVQSVSAIYKNGIDHIGRMVADLGEWMEARGYSSVSDFRGKLSARNNPDEEAFTRAHYIKMLKVPEMHEMDGAAGVSWSDPARKR